MATLFIVPTPIGNLEDITLRAIRVLKEADLILAEDTRTSSILLNHLNIKKPLVAYHKFNEHGIINTILDKINGGTNIALISDAGTPGISDPGFLLVRECIANNIKVETLPGATALIPALINSGFPCDKFCFEGFLPQKKRETNSFATTFQGREEHHSLRIPAPNYQNPGNDRQHLSPSPSNFHIEGVN